MASSIDNLSIWINYIFPTLLAPLLVGLKSLWDRYATQRLEKKIIIEKNTIEITKIKLEKFYWPIYIRLLKIYQIESNIKIENTFRHKKNSILNDASSVSSNTSDDEEDEEEQIDWFILNNKNKKNKLYKIKILEEENIFKTKSPSQSNYSDNDLKSIESLKIEIEENNNTPRISDTPRISKTSHYIDIDGEFLNNMLLNIFEIYCEIEDIIIKYIHISQTNNKLKKELLKFLKFITILKILKKNNKNNLNPNDLGASYPKKLLEYIEKYVNYLQKIYNKLRLGEK